MLYGGRFKGNEFLEYGYALAVTCVCFEEAGERESAKENSILDTEEASMSGRIIIGISTGGSLWMHIVH